MAFRRGGEPRNRTFALAYYSCLLQAGNRLHHYFNNLLWAIVTNRTVLWKSYDRTTCLASQSMYAGGGGEGEGTAKLNTKITTDLDLICQAANTVHKCDEVLERASWIPSYDEWADTLELSDPLTLNFWTTHPPLQRERQHQRPSNEQEWTTVLAYGYALPVWTVARIGRWLASVMFGMWDLT
jgi:hypothetical protein